MFRFTLFLSVIIYSIINAFYNSDDSIEGVSDSENCCRSGNGFDSDGTIPGNAVDSRCTSGHKFQGVKRCMGPTDTFDCGGECNLCNFGEQKINDDRSPRNRSPNVETHGVCIPTPKGGYCKKNNEFKIYDSGEWVDVERKHRGGDIRAEARAIEDYKTKYADECNPFKRDDGDDEDYDEEGAEEDEDFRGSGSGSGSGSDYGSDYGSEPWISKTTIFLIFLLMVLTVGGGDYIFVIRKSGAEETSAIEAIEATKSIPSSEVSEVTEVTE